jgi:hypothetical protein
VILAVDDEQAHRDANLRALVPEDVSERLESQP